MLHVACFDFGIDQKVASTGVKTKILANTTTI